MRELNDATREATVEQAAFLGEALSPVCLMLAVAGATTSLRAREIEH